MTRKVDISSSFLITWLHPEYKLTCSLDFVEFYVIMNEHLFVNLIVLNLYVYNIPILFLNLL